MPENNSYIIFNGSNGQKPKQSDINKDQTEHLQTNQYKMAMII